MTDLFRTLTAWLERLGSRSLATRAVRHNGAIRRYLLYVPRHLRDAGPLPLVLMLHGGAGRPRDIARASRMHRIAEREGFIVAYPAGTPGGFGLTWNPGGQVRRSTSDDVGFIAAVVDDVRANHPVDPARIYAAGMSIGGSMTYRLACSLSETLAAVGVVAGAMTYEDCRPARPVSVIHIHGTDDRRVPVGGGRGPRTAPGNVWPPVWQAIDRWRTIDGCPREAEVVRLVSGLIGHRYIGTRGDVELWLVEGGRHVWPGAPPRGWFRRARPQVRFSASEKIWQFFAEHARTKS
ncbi:MAG: polyhydroxybutyrate depolymerase [Proteobacteria bacterium]|nr:polyhydroxybutyrate depolymerase [Pseudomonadota bacterium]